MRFQLVVVLVGLVGCAFDPGGVAGRGADAGSEPDGPAVADEPDAAPLTVMIRVPESGFAMGCAPGHGGASCRDDELPIRQVLVSEFEIDKDEVTQGDYARCVAEGSCSLPSCDFAPGERGDHPAVCVSWFQARDFCAWRGARLPTEAEWEKAARSDTGRAYPWGNQKPDCRRANFDECGSHTWRVGSASAGDSPFGTRDMAGNVYEWVADWYAPGYYAQGTDADPQGPESGSARVARGGSFMHGPEHLRSSRRSRNAPSSAFVDLGFRCAR